MNMDEGKKPGRPKAEEKSPMLPAKIIQAYGETGSLEKTASRCGIAANTVNAILMRHPEDFALAKKALATRMLTIAEAATEIAEARLDECSGPQAAVVAGIMSQRALELTQGVSVGQINVGVVREIIELKEAIETELKRRQLEVAAEVVEDKPGDVKG